MAVTEMVPDLTRAPHFFGPREIWSTRNVGPIKCHSIMIFMWEPNLYGTKFLGDKISLGPINSGAQFIYIRCKTVVNHILYLTIKP